MKKIHFTILVELKKIVSFGFVSVLFIIMLVTCTSIVSVYSNGWTHFFTKTYYPNHGTGRTSVFTTKDWRAVYALYGPFEWDELGYDISLRFFNSSGNLIPPAWANGSIVATFKYAGGVVVCMENYFYISGNGEAREPGQYRVDIFEKEADSGTYEFLFTDYFQIWVNETFQINVDGAICNVTVLSNSTLSAFNFSNTEKKIAFNVTGTDDTIGFCNLTLPSSLIQDLWQESVTVLVNGEEPLMLSNCTDGTCTYVYFTYNHSTQEVIMIPESPTLTSMLLLSLFAVSIAIRKRRLLKTPIH